MSGQINIFLPNNNYAAARNSFGTKNHVYELYDWTFKDVEHRIWPSGISRPLLQQAVLSYFDIAPGSLNVSTQGYSVLSTSLAVLTKPRVRVIVHTWKVPGYSDSRLTARFFDLCLRIIVQRAALVVVVSKQQVRQLHMTFPDVPVWFAPVTVDSRFWTDALSQPGTLERYNLNPDGYVLTIGGNDRCEDVSLEVAARLGMEYVRVSRYKSIADSVGVAERRLGLVGKARILENVDDVELISLYQNAYAVLLPTVTRTNPAGLSAVVEAMSCGGIVAAYRNLVDGYISHESSGIVLDEGDGPHEIADLLRASLSQTGARKAMRANARQSAQTTLNVENVGSQLQQTLRELELL